MKKSTRLILSFTGLGIIALTHLYMLIAGLSPNMMTGHAIVNLSAGVLLAIAVFKK
jgi:hypothetical protein